jgi:hypothetical protein
MSDGGYFHGGPGFDYESKGWLRRPRVRERLLDFARALTVLAMILFVLAAILQAIDAHASTFTILLAISREPATMDEGQQADPQHRRPVYCISHQERSDEFWHHRFCSYAQ